MGWLRKGLLAISLLGILFSGAGLAVTFIDERHFEDLTRQLVTWQVEREIRDLVTLPPVEEGGALAALRNRMTDSIESSKRLLGSDLPERIAETIAELCACDLDYEDREEHERRFNEAKDSIASIVRSGLASGIALTRIKIGTLDDLISGYYVETVEGLKRDLRIFFGSNLVLYTVVGLGVLFSGLGNALVIPAFLLFIGTVTSSGLYLFGQNWLATILFQDWTGFAYLAWVAFITVFLADVFLNKARVTLRILGSINWIPIPVLPC